MLPPMGSLCFRRTFSPATSSFPASHTCLPGLLFAPSIASHQSPFTAFRFATHAKTGIVVTCSKQTIEAFPVRNKFEGFDFA